MTGKDVSADLSAKFPRSSFPAMSNVRNIKEVKNLSSPRAKRAGPKGPCAESARAVTGRRCPHSGVGEDFLVHRPGPLTKTGITQE